MAFDSSCQMPSKTDFCVRSLTQIAWKNGKRPFVPGAANDRKEPILWKKTRSQSQKDAR